MDLFKRKALSIPNTQRRNLDLLTAQINRNIAVYPTYDIAAYSERYVTTDDLYSIFNKIATHSARIPIYGYLVKDDAAKKKLNKIKQPHLKQHEVKSLSLKALEDLPETDPVEQLLEFPCEGMSKFEFYYAIHTFLLSAGEAFILKVRPEFGKNAGKPVTLQILYPQNVILKVSDTLPRKVMYYDYTINGQKVFENIPAEDVIHIKYFNPQIDYSGSELRGLSPLRVLLRRLERLDSNMNVSVAQMQNGGVNTIVFDKAPNDTGAVEIVGARKDNYYRFKNNSANTGAPFFASGEMGAIQLGLSLADLSVLELANVDFKKLCNAYSISDRLFNNDATGSEVSDDNARKGLYTDACLPNVYRIVDALKLNLLNEFTDKKRELLADVSEIPELQENYKELAETFAAMPVIIPNEIMRAFKYEVSTDPNMDKPYIKTGYMSMDEAQGIEDLPINTPNGN